MHACRAGWGVSARGQPEGISYLRLEREAPGRGRREAQK